MSRARQVRLTLRRVGGLRQIKIVLRQRDYQLGVILNPRPVVSRGLFQAGPLHNRAVPAPVSLLSSRERANGEHDRN